MSGASKALLMTDAAYGLHDVNLKKVISFSLGSRNVSQSDASNEDNSEATGGRSHGVAFRLRLSILHIESY